MKKSIYLALYNLRSLYNVGAIFRSADAFGIKKIFLCGITAYPPRRQMEKIAKTALGAEKSVPWEYCRQTSRLIKKLKSQGVKIIALENNIKNNIKAINELSLSDYKPEFPLVLIVGNEVNGINKKILALSDETVYIPMKGKKESLNAAIAAAIVMYQLTK